MNSRFRITWIIHLIGRAVIQPEHPAGEAQPKTIRITKTSPKVQPLEATFSYVGTTNLSES